ncbi:ERAD-associated E3 ubiquitin-protein ligase HRD1-like [Prosopis cineraria]|uniref:ERAD-associated E3 ubiquitin-protein ligase HRD1-like n=1 Tax=Prosopis cineraria TaxID=364024 RepID=UPI00240F2A3C|nr:ERAD-associated E3 ubiquitin-protein ligase HRD1-like [Prosopis cineraria]
MPCGELIRDVPGFLRTNVANYLSENDFESLASKITSYYQEVIQHTTIEAAQHLLIPLIVYFHVHVDPTDHGLAPMFFHLQLPYDEYAMDIDYIRYSTRTDHFIEHQFVQESSYHQQLATFAEYNQNLHVISDDDDDDDDVESRQVNEAIEQSMQHLFMVPATEKALTSLKKMKMSSNEAKASQCSICLENFDDDGGGDDGVDASALPCDHIFHNNCIVKWLKTGHTCPLCRFQLPIE